ncbi:MAG: tRNA 2-thiouridine(34) synthase MnmA [Patescibacteria group bacterium]
MAKGQKVFVGISGGVDSAVSAALLQQQGYDVIGVFIKIVVDGYPCTAGVDRIDAMRVAAHLQIPFREIDLSKQYQDEVFRVSIAEFKEGKTPNPDVLCNREIKFGLFYDYAMQNGADFVATGHYAQIQDGRLYAGADKEKDQSYFLALVPRAVLQKTLFPIGHLQKSEVRKLAAKFGLPNAARKDSQGLCFLGPISIADMLQHELGPVVGNVLDQSGGIVGTHHGAALYTLGQRHGFEVAHSTPLFVIAKDIAKNTITVSPDKTPGKGETTLQLRNTNWLGAPDGAYMARYRYRQNLIPARKSGDTITLSQPQYAPEGQLLALYDGDPRYAEGSGEARRCVGGGIISAAWLSSSPKQTAK